MIVGKATDEEEFIVKITFIDDDDWSAILFVLLDDLPIFEEDDFTCLEEELFELFFEELESNERSSSTATELACVVDSSKQPAIKAATPIIKINFFIMTSKYNITFFPFPPPHTCSQIMYIVAVDFDNPADSDSFRVGSSTICLT